MGKLILGTTSVRRLDTPEGVDMAREAIKEPNVSGVLVPIGTLKDPSRPREEDKPYYSIYQDEAYGYRLRDEEGFCEVGNFASIAEAEVAAQQLHDQKYP